MGGKGGEGREEDRPEEEAEGEEEEHMFMANLSQGAIMEEEEAPGKEGILLLNFMFLHLSTASDQLCHTWHLQCHRFTKVICRSPVDTMDMLSSLIMHIILK